MWDSSCDPQKADVVTDVARYFAKFKTLPSTTNQNNEARTLGALGRTVGLWVTACMDFRLVHRLAWLCPVCARYVSHPSLPPCTPGVLNNHPLARQRSRGGSYLKEKREGKKKTHPFCSRRKVLVKKLSFIWCLERGRL